MGQGQGRWTARKEDGFAAAFAISLKISMGPRVIRYPYWHADLNAGCGENELIGCRGSPVVFLDTAAIPGRQVRAFFCDNDPAAVARLESRLSVYPLSRTIQVECVCEDNGRFLERFAGLIVERERPQFAVGSVLCDPNGFRSGFPSDELAVFAKRFPRIDIILNLPIGLFLRVRGCKQSATEAIRKGFLGWPDLADVIARFPRSDWLIRNPPPRGGNGGGEVFTTLVGRNLRAGQSLPREFFRLDSPVGQQIVNRLVRVELEQPSLFDEVSDE